MAPPPPVELDPADWPDPDEAGVTHLSPELAGKVLVTLTQLGDYIERQYARCAEH